LIQGTIAGFMQALTSLAASVMVLFFLVFQHQFIREFST
jgi:hypothetical protein